MATGGSRESSQRKALTQRFDRKLHLQCCRQNCRVLGHSREPLLPIAELLSYKAAPLQAWGAARRLAGEGG